MSIRSTNMIAGFLVLVSAASALGAADGRLPSFRNVPSMLREYRDPNLQLMRDRLNAHQIGQLSYLDIARTLLQNLPTNITDECAKECGLMLRQFGSAWTLEMLDSFGKPASGLLEGNFLWLGDFDQCIGVTLPADSDPQFQGQYCKLSYTLEVAGRATPLTIGGCFPSGCNSDDSAALVNTVLTLIGVKNGTGMLADCHLLDRPYDSGTYTAIVIFSLFGVLLVAGTLYDILTTLRNTSSNVREAELDGRSDINRPSLDSEKAPLLNGSAARHFLGSSRASTNTSIGYKLLLSFSYYSNGKKFLSTGQGDGSLGCLNGIRFLSMCWVILGHAYVFTTAVLSDPSVAYTQILKRWSFQVVFNASVSVDSFFLLSGLLVAYITIKEFEKRQGRLSAKEWIMLYVHRYIRLTAVYALLLMVWACLANHFYDGPLWPTSGSLDPSCSKYWWTNLLYINNFIPSASDKAVPCMDWTWYLANDMQFYLITPVLVYLLYRVWYIGVAVTSVLIVASVGASAAVSVSDSLGISFVAAEDPSEAGGWFEDLYIKPWTRFQAYGVGVLLGYLLYRWKGKISLPLPFVIGGWIAAAIICLSIVYAPHDAEFGSRASTVSLSEAAAYNSLSRVAWCIGLSWVIFACSTGNGGWINTLLSWKPFIPLARLTYCAYLIHPILYTMAALGSRDTIHFDDLTVTLKFIGVMVMSMALAFLSSLSFEAPIMGVEKLLLHPEQRK